MTLKKKTHTHTQFILNALLLGLHYRKYFHINQANFKFKIINNKQPHAKLKSIFPFVFFQEKISLGYVHIFQLLRSYCVIIYAFDLFNFCYKLFVIVIVVGVGVGVGVIAVCVGVLTQQRLVFNKFCTQKLCFTQKF